MDGEGAITAWLSILIVDPFTAPWGTVIYSTTPRNGNRHF